MQASSSSSSSLRDEEEPSFAQKTWVRTVGGITGHSDKEFVLHSSHVTAESATWARSAMERRGRRRSGEGDEASSGKIARFLAWAETATTATTLTAVTIEWIAAARVI